MPLASLPLLPGRGPPAPRGCTPVGAVGGACSELTLGSWAPLSPFSPSRFGLDLRAGFLGSRRLQGQGSTPMCSAYSNQTSGSAAYANIYLHGQSQVSAAPPSQTHTHEPTITHRHTHNHTKCKGTDTYTSHTHTTWNTHIQIYPDIYNQTHVHNHTKTHKHIKTKRHTDICNHAHTGKRQTTTQTHVDIPNTHTQPHTKI